DSVFRILDKETADNDLQQKRLDTLSTYIHERYGDMHFAIKHLAESGFLLDDSLRFREHKGRADMENIRSLAMRMQLHEENLLETRSQKLSDQFVALYIII